MGKMWLVSMFQRFAKGLGCAAVLSAAVVGAAAQAQDFQIVVGEQVIVEGQEQVTFMSAESFMAAQAQQNFIEILPSITSTQRDFMEPEQEAFFACFDPISQTLVPNCDISISLQRVPNSGSHDHDDSSRPLGRFEPASGNSGSDAIFETKYFSPEVSGVFTFTVAGVGPQGQIFAPLNLTIGVRVPGLKDLGSGANYNLIGQTTIHLVNHFGTPQFNAKLVKVANRYAAAFPGNKLSYNDISLPLGGILDLGANWLPSHELHRLGADVDLRSITIPQSHRNKLKNIINNSGIRTVGEETTPPHWHLRE